MSLADGKAVETQLFGEHGGLDDIAQPVGRVLLLTRNGVRMVSDQRDQQT